MADRNKINEMLEATLSKLRQLGESDTIIGKPVVLESGITVIPVSKLSCGFGAGGSDYNTRHNSNAVLFGGGGGAGIELTPVSFVVINGDRVEVLPAAGTVATPEPSKDIAGTIDKIASTLPGLIEKIEGFIEKQKEKKAAKSDKEEESDISVKGE